MHKYLEELLQGETVEWKTLGEVCDYEQPSKYLVTDNNYNDEYHIPVLTAGKTFILGYTDEKEGIYRASKNKCIIFDDFTTANKWVDFDFKIKSSAIKIITSKNKNTTTLRYIFHWLNTISNIGNYTDHKRQWISNFSNMKLPIPPLKTQQKIVDILDKLYELKTALKTERDLRLKQYEYYRDKLLTFGDEMEWKELGEVCDYEQPTKYIVKSNNYDDENNIPVLTAGKTFILGYTNENDGIYDALNNPCIIFDDFTTANKWIDFRFKIKSSAIKILKDKGSVNLKYIFYWLNTLPNIGEYSDHKRQWISNFSKMRIPVPSLEKQHNIVNMLDKLNNYSNSLTSGLPREIELREKQYQYYRDLLLGFDNQGKED